MREKFVSKALDEKGEEHRTCYSICNTLNGASILFLLLNLYFMFCHLFLQKQGSY